MGIHIYTVAQLFLTHHSFHFSIATRTQLQSSSEGYGHGSAPLAGNAAGVGGVPLSLSDRKKAHLLHLSSTHGLHGLQTFLYTFLSSLKNNRQQQQGQGQGQRQQMQKKQ